MSRGQLIRHARSNRRNKEAHTRKVRSCRARCGVCRHCGVVRRQRAACKTRWFLNRDTCRGCNNQRDEKHDECSQTAAWPQLGGGSCGDAAHHVNKPKGLALARQQLAQAEASAMPEECIRTLESEVQQEEAAMKQAQPLGQKMDQARARFRRALVAGEKAMQALQKAQGEFRASAAGGDAGPDRRGKAHAASDASSTSQCEPGQNLGGFDRDHRKCGTQTQANHQTT